MISPELLRRFCYFAGVSDESLKQVAMISEAKTFQAGDVLFQAEETADTLYIVTHGEVDIQSVRADGELKSVDTLVGGDLMVWSAVVGPHRTHFAGVARQETRAIAIDGRKLRKLCEKDPKLGFRLMTEVAQAVTHRLEGAQVQLAAVD